MILAVVILVQNTKVFSPERRAISQLVDKQGFKFSTWEAVAVKAKIEAALVSAPSYIEPENQKKLVLDYAEAVGASRRLSRELEVAFTTDDNAEESSAELQQQLADKRAEAARLQDSAEAVLEQQVGTMLVAQSFDMADVIMPPVKARMTPLPLMLIISPRDRIEQIYAFPLQHGLTIAEQEALEQQIFEQNSLSALVVPIGGLGIYPAMIIETGNINYLADVIAHEWAHHWLSFRPLGFNYGTHPQTRIINETVASVLGKEMGPIIIKRYYPELAPPPTPEPVEAVDDVEEEGAGDSAENASPPAFEFRATMRETREQTDALLAAGSIEEAEAYMEAQRQIFIEEGFLLRKINQSYFAFYGAYAAQEGATGGNPIGPTVLAVRENTPTLRAFMDTVAKAQQLDDLEQILTELGGVLSD